MEFTFRMFGAMTVIFDIGTSPCGTVTVLFRLLQLGLGPISKAEVFETSALS